MNAVHDNAHESLSFASKFEKKLLANTVLHSNTGFADIFIEASGDHIPSSEIVIPQKRADQKIYDMYIQMRRLYKAKGIMAVHGLDAFIFCKQGRLLENFEDNYKESAEFSEDIPTYQKLSYEQFRTYFTWRTKVKSGIVEKTSLSYVLLYIFEIINNIGTESDADGLARLTHLWTEYVKFDKSINDYLCTWFKDYYITRCFDKPFYMFISEYELLRKIYGNRPSSDHFALYEEISNYKYKESEFYSEETAKDIRDYFNFIVDSINARHDNIFWFDEIVRSCPRGMQWIPFKNAIHDSTESFEKINIYKTIHISSDEVYWYSHSKWFKSTDIYFKPWSQMIVGYIIKRTESFLRGRTGFKKLRSEPTKAGRERLIRLLGEEDFESIDRLITEFYVTRNKISVTVDQEKLKEIREHALETQAKLLAYTEDSADGDDYTINAPIDANANDQNDFTEDAGDESDSNAWISLVKKLTPIERGMLDRIIAGEGISDISKYARENHAMPEMLADSINEKAAEIVNDTILELSDTAVIYEEYLDFLKGAMQSETE